MNKLSVDELHKWRVTDKPFFLIDVREEEEHVQFSIGGKLIPLGSLMLQKREIPKDLPVVIYCEKGIRSTIAIQRLEAIGYNNLYNLEGGMKAWKLQYKE